VLDRNSIFESFRGLRRYSGRSQWHGRPPVCFSFFRRARPHTDETPVSRSLLDTVPIGDCPSQISTMRHEPRDKSADLRSGAKPAAFPQRAGPEVGAPEGKVILNAHWNWPWVSAQSRFSPVSHRRSRQDRRWKMGYLRSSSKGSFNRGSRGFFLAIFRPIRVHPCPSVVKKTVSFRVFRGLPCTILISR
jgi:hypothetical protein